MNPELTSKLKTTAMSVAVAIAMGSSITANADLYTFSYAGAFTMLDSTGAALINTSITSYGPWGGGKRTDISGTLSIEDSTLAGSMTIAPFAFYNAGNAVATSVTFQPIGSNLLLVNMGFNWNSNNGIPVSLVWDGTGLLTAVNAGMTNGQTLNSASPGNATPATDGINKGKIALGAVPLATTTWNTTLVGAACTGVNGLSCMTRNPSGTTPIISDTLGGSPMIAGPFVGFSANFDLTTLTVTSLTAGTDTTPNGFVDFTSAAPPLSTVTPSNTVTITGIDTATQVSISGGLNAQYSIDGGSWTSASGYIRNNHTIQVRHTSAATGSTQTITNLTVGTVTRAFTSTTTLVVDTAPDSFGFVTQPDVARSTLITSASIQPTGFNTATTISVANGEYQINGAGSWYGPSAPVGVFSPGDTVMVRHTSLSTFSGTGVTTLTIGGVPGTFTTTTLAADTIPDAFTFVDQIVVETNTPTESAAIVVAGINTTSEIFIAGGEYSKDGGSTWTNVTGTVVNGDSVKVRHTSSASNLTPVNTVLTIGGTNGIGGVSDTFTSITKAAGAKAFTGAFTMLTSIGNLVGRDTLVTGTYDATVLNTTSTGTVINMMKLQSPAPFYGKPWTAHDVRVFGPGTYHFNSGCTAAEIRLNGGASCAISGPVLNITVGTGQLGAHILFDWSGSVDIDVAQVWNTDGTPSAVKQSQSSVYALASSDGDGDHIAGFPMVDGPFTGFNANFDIKFQSYDFSLTTTSAGTITKNSTDWKEIEAPAALMPANFSAPGGAIDFIVRGLTSAGQSVTITLSAPNLKANDKVYFIDLAGKYFDLGGRAGTIIDYNAKTVTFVLTDGGFGDTDGSQDQKIECKGIAVLTPVSQLASSSGSGGGGCAVGGTGFDPVLPGSLLAALAWLGWRRRKH